MTDFDHCPWCAGRIRDLDPDGYEAPDGQRGHLSCQASGAPLPTGELHDIVGWLEQQPGTEDALRAINAGYPAGQELANFMAGWHTAPFEPIRDHCPEWCGHEGSCAEARADIHAGEREAEQAWVKHAELPLLTEPMEDEEWR